MKQVQDQAGQRLSAIVCQVNPDTSPDLRLGTTQEDGWTTIPLKKIIVDRLHVQKDRTLFLFWKRHQEPLAVRAQNWEHAHFLLRQMYDQEPLIRDMIHDMWKESNGEVQDEKTLRQAFMTRPLTDMVFEDEEWFVSSCPINVKGITSVKTQKVYVQKV